MENFEKLFSDVYQDVTRKKTYITKSFENRSVTVNESYDSAQDFETMPVGPQNELLLQNKIRPLFGKIGVNSSSIGTHPDFIDLEGTDTGTTQHYACTLFVDIMGSTRLSLLYPLDKIFLFKNAVIKTCVEVIRSFDGHVHRLMGDAVMAFFGGNNIEKENAIADAINCCITLRAVLEESIKPWMENNGFEAKDFGFRIGCDFGDDHEVLWGSFGYHNVGEVSATGLPVDMASKLQSLASKNQTMLGQGLLDYVNWPEQYSKIKEKTKNGSPIQLPVVIPNLTNSVGDSLNYNMRLLDYSNFMNFSALPRNFRANIKDSKVIDNIEINYKCYVIEEGKRSNYISASRYLNKNISLEFEVIANTRGRLHYPLSVYYTKTNHGQETPGNERNSEQPYAKKILSKVRQNSHNKAPLPFSKAVLEEGTSYRGLHTMKCEIKDCNGFTVFLDWIGIMIK